MDFSTISANTKEKHCKPVAALQTGKRECFEWCKAGLIAFEACVAVDDGGIIKGMRYFFPTNDALEFLAWAVGAIGAVGVIASIPFSWYLSGTVTQVLGWRILVFLIFFLTITTGIAALLAGLYFVGCLVISAR